MSARGGRPGKQVNLSTAVTGGACSTQLSLKEAMDIFFPVADNKESLLRAREICVDCPVFDQCRSWATRNFAAVPYGTYFGEIAPSRNNLRRGRKKWKDWRLTNWREETRVEREHREMDEDGAFKMYHWTCDACGAKSKGYFPSQNQSDYFLHQHERNKHPELFKQSA